MVIAPLAQLAVHRVTTRHQRILLFHGVCLLQDVLEVPAFLFAPGAAGRDLHNIARHRHFMLVVRHEFLAPLDVMLEQRVKMAAVNLHNDGLVHLVRHDRPYLVPGWRACRH